MLRTTFSVFAFLALAVAPVAAQTPPTTPAAPCASPDHRAFDFWVGEWDVFPNGSDKQVATSRIELMFGGCAVRETWMPLKGSGGGSFSHYDRDQKQWRQAWVDGSGSRVDFDGGLAGDAMVLTGQWRHSNGPGKHALTRMIYRRNADGSVRQHGEQSTDHGITWSTSFDFIYRARNAAKGD